MREYEQVLDAGVDTALLSFSKPTLVTLEYLGVRGDGEGATLVVSADGAEAATLTRPGQRFVGEVSRLSARAMGAAVAVEIDLPLLVTPAEVEERKAKAAAAGPAPAKLALDVDILPPWKEFGVGDGALPRFRVLTVVSPSAYLPGTLHVAVHVVHATGHLTSVGPESFPVTEAVQYVDVPATGLAPEPGQQVRVDAVLTARDGAMKRVSLSTTLVAGAATPPDPHLSSG